MRPAALSFARTYLIALVVLSAIGLGTTLYLRQAASAPSGLGAPRPTGAVLQPYALAAQRGSAVAATISVDVDGRACEDLIGSDFLKTACVLALNIDPTFIAGEAFGRLNTEDTPSAEAMVWRAVLSDDPDVCDRGGLVGDRLSRCRIAAGKPSYSITRDGWTITIAREAAH